MDIDYKILLWKYINHVYQSEGVSFIDRLNDRMASDVSFTDDEVDMLKFLDSYGGGEDDL